MTRPLPNPSNRSAITWVGLLLALTLLAFALRLHQLGAHSLWYDELLQLDIAQGRFAEIGPKLVRHAAMPLDYYLLHGWIKLGRQDAWVRFPALFFGVLSVPLIYALGLRLFNRRVGVVAAALLALSPFAVDYSQEARPYAMLLFWVLVTYFGLWQAYQTRRSRYWGVTILGLVCAALTHYFTLFMLVPLGLFVAVYQLYHLKQEKIWQYTAIFGASMLVLLLIFTVYGRLGHLYSVGERFVREIDQLDAYTLPSSDKPNRGSGPPLEKEFFVEKVLIPLSAVRPVTLLLYNLFFVVSVGTLVGRRQNNSGAILLLLAWLILPVGLIYAFLLHRGTFYAIRYILYTLPAYLLLVAYGIDTLAGVSTKLLARRVHRPPLPVSLFAAGLLLVLLAPQFNQLLVSYRTDSREDWRAVGELLHKNALPGDAVIAVRAEPAMNWYYPPANTPFGTYSRSQPIWRAIRQHPRRWFVLSSYSFKRDKGLRDWLKEQQAVTIAIDRRVVVYFHQEGKSSEEMLARVKTFALPQKALTYRVLADQFKQNGDVETSRAFYQKARQLAQNSTPRQRTPSTALAGAK